MSILSLHKDSVREFTRRVHAIQKGEWDLPTPCDGWSVRDLVNHVAYGDLWVRPLLEGKTLEEVGDRFEGDVLGQDDPVAGYDRAADDAVLAASQADLGAKVHTSGGIIDAAEYLAQRVMDNLVHAWDLARAIGASEAFDPELVTFVLAMFEPHGGGPRSMFAEPVEIPEGADEMTKLLALTGRRM
ncbi:MAG TPA: TIGR03086 family metal-binding protein [Actinomycetota bacterium]|nr:TIGR03086 family metal-binding protein [Actinomycetota bacterium]